MPDFARRFYTRTGLDSLLCQDSGAGKVCSEPRGDGKSGDYFHALERFEESTVKDVARVFSICDGSDGEGQLLLDRTGYGFLGDALDIFWKRGGITRV
jgi:hypothetical protein